jgi:glycosyltransferase involved in cell wall biosynthesis
MRVAISINTAWNITNFRGGLLRALKANGCEVIAMAPPDAYADRLTGMGCRFIPIKIDSKGTNPLKDASLYLRYLHIFRREKPDAFLGFTIKPNVYGSLAAQACGIPVINNVSGLGTAFIRDTWLTRAVKALYALAFARSSMIFFQNEDDRRLFIQQRLVEAERTALLPGSGIDLEHFKPPMQGKSRPHGFRFLLIGRLLYDKGVSEFAAAARILKSPMPGVSCALLGFLDADNRTAISQSELEHWVREGVVEYLGAADDVRPHIAAADCVVLPSYREGTPRTLLEAAAMGKPIVATDVPGCREVVEHGRTGLLCRAKDAADLAASMIKIANKTPSERHAMGVAGRRKMEREFDERLVIGAYLAVLASIVRPAALNPGTAPLEVTQ